MTSRLKSAASERSGMSATATRSAARKILRVDLCMVKTPSGSSLVQCVRRTLFGCQNEVWFARLRQGRTANSVKLCQRARSISHMAGGGKEKTGGRGGQQEAAKARLAFDCLLAPAVCLPSFTADRKST